jgi:membrane protease YdiL (CAAX protease family)
MIALAGLLVLIGRFDDLQTNFYFAHSMYAIVGIVNTVLILWWYKKLDKQNPWQLGFQIGKKDIFFTSLAVIVSLAMVLGFIAGLDYLGIVRADYRFEQVGTSSFYTLLGAAVIGWFFAALKEEVLARGYFMANLTRWSIPKMLFLSALLFMALHFVMGDFDPFKAGSWLKGGIVYGYIYLKSGSLTVSTIVHAAHNLVNDMVIHGSEGALVLLNTKVSTDDKLVYEIALGTILLILTYAFYGKNGLFTPAQNLKMIWRKAA